MIEAPVRDALVVWDGRVLEIFAMDMSLRYAGSVLPKVEIDGDMVKFTLKDTTIKFWFFDDAQRPQVEALVAAVST